MLLLQQGLDGSCEEWRSRAEQFDQAILGNAQKLELCGSAQTV